MKVSLVQMNTQDDKSANLKSAKALIEKAVAEEQPDLVVLPEYYAFLGDTPAELQDSAETFPNGESYRLMSGLAEKHGITIHAGSVAERDGDDFYNATVVFGPNGRQIAHYLSLIHI